MSITDRNGLGKIVVLMGGTSAERQVSLSSGKAMAEALEQRGHQVETLDLTENYLSQVQAITADRVLIALHGGFGENGEIQALLEACRLPYSGSGTATCALTLDKAKTKYVLKGLGLPTADFIEVIQGAPLDTAAYIQSLGLPLFVKPVNEGSSVGIRKVMNESELQQAIDAAFQYDSRVLVEAFMPGEEYTVAWLEGRALPSIRISSQSEFYDYDAKYITGTTQYHIPSGLNDQEEQHIAELTQQIATVVGLDTWGRIDFIKDAQGQLNVIEINTVPGMTESSLLPKAAAVAEVPFAELVERIVAKASLKTRLSA
jgi:D-alanine-D-alanine ligase